MLLCHRRHPFPCAGDGAAGGRPYRQTGEQQTAAQSRDHGKHQEALSRISGTLKQAKVDPGCFNSNISKDKEMDVAHFGFCPQLGSITSAASLIC